MDLNKVNRILDPYLEQHTTPEDPVLAELARYTYLNEVHPRMLTGQVMGSFLHLFSTLLAPERILEIGTYTGYSAICLARGLREGGKLITLEVNDELRETALDFFALAGLADRIELLNGNALELIPLLPGPFDLVFIDGNKEDYLLFYKQVIGKVASGGYILADNVLWGGKVLDQNTQDASTLALKKFNEYVKEDPTVENLLLPIRDGVMVLKKL